MKKLLSIFLAASIFFSCKKEEQPIVSVKYEVVTSRGGFSQINYTDADGQDVTVKNLERSSWMEIFKPSGARPQVLFVSAISNLYTVADTDITLKIYVNGECVATAAARNSTFLTHVIN